jgi:hypothetical protein
MFEDSKPIPSEVWIIMMVSHVHGLQHLLMYSRVGEPSSSIIPLRLVKGGNFICMCKVKGYRMTWAHVQDRNLHSFVEVKSPLRHVQILVSTTQDIPCSIYTSTREGHGEPLLNPPTLSSLAAAAILVAGGSRHTVAGFRKGLAKCAYVTRKCELILYKFSINELEACDIPSHSWYRTIRNS